ncbi:MAG: MarR family transcriptional regulator, partial [Chloroflexi bacterium]
ARVIRGLIQSRRRGVVLAPHFTDLSKELLRDAKWGWIDDEGNAHIEAPGVLIHIERPATGQIALSAVRIPPQGERIVRYLLDRYPEPVRWNELRRTTLLDRGYTSRIVRRLAAAGLVTSQLRRPISVVSPAELFESWRSMPEHITETQWF